MITGRHVTTGDHDPMCDYCGRPLGEEYRLEQIDREQGITAPWYWCVRADCGPLENDRPDGARWVRDIASRRERMRRLFSGPSPSPARATELRLTVSRLELAMIYPPPAPPSPEPETLVQWFASELELALEEGVRADAHLASRVDSPAEATLGQVVEWLRADNPLAASSVAGVMRDVLRSYLDARSRETSTRQLTVIIDKK